MNKTYKNTIIAILLGCILTMAIGYSLLQQKLNIAGTSSISSIFDVRFTKITSTNNNTGASNKVNPSFTDTTANFSTNLVKPGDSMTYSITVSNKGTLDAQLLLVTLSDTNNEAIDFTFYGVKEGDILPAGQSVIVTVVVRYDMSISSQPSNIDADLSIKLDYGQRDINTNDEFVVAGSYLRQTSSTFSTDKWFNGPLMRNEIESISFTDTNIVPEDVGDNYFDVSHNYDDSIIAWYYDSDGDNLYEIVIGQPNGVMANPNSSDLFENMTYLESIDFTNFDTSYVKSMKSMFYNTNKLYSVDVSNFDTSNVTSLNYIFSSSKISSLDLSSWDTGNVTDMSGMFSQCYNLTDLKLGDWDTSSVIDMSYMFNRMQNVNNLDVSGFDTSNVRYMNHLFAQAGIDYLDLSKWNTSKVTNMRNMFERYSGTVQGISNFNTRNVTDMSFMFESSHIGKHDLSNWNVSNVTNMNYMFNGSDLGDQDFSKWNVSNVEKMGSMFNNSNMTKLDLSTWETPKLSYMPNMFSSNSYLTYIDISNFDTTKVTNMDGLLYYCKKLEKVYVGDKWSTDAVTSTGNLFKDNLVLVGAIPFDSTKVDISMANYETGYFTYKSSN